MQSFFSAVRRWAAFLPRPLGRGGLWHITISEGLTGSEDSDGLWLFQVSAAEPVQIKMVEAHA